MADAQLAAALPGLLSPDASIRAAAEATASAIRAQPAAYLPALSRLAGSCEQPELKQMCILLLKRGSTTDEWKQVDPQGQAEVKERLLAMLSSQNPSRVLSTLTNTIAVLAVAISEANGTWDELLPSVFTTMTSQEPVVQHAGLVLLSEMSDVLPSAALEAFVPLVPTIFAQAMSAQSPPEVRIQAVKTACSLVVQQAAAKGGEKKVEGLQPLLPTIMDVLSACITSKNDQGSRDILSSLCDIVGFCPNFLRSCLMPTLNATLALAGNTSVDESVRCTALELLIQYAEIKATQFRKAPGLLDNVLALIMQFIDGVKEESDWDTNVADREEADEEQEMVEMAEAALDRLLTAVGGSKGVSPTLNLVQARIQQPQWQLRYSALRAITIMSGTANEALEEQLPSVLSAVLSFANDPQPRVVWAGLGALAALLSYYGPDIQNRHHSSIMGCIIPLLHANVHPRIRSRAAMCIVDFMCECSEDEIDMVDSYSDQLLTILTDMVVNGSTAHKLAAVGAISGVASALQQRFNRFYAHLMPGFIGMLSHTDTRDREARELRGKAMECVSCIADAVGVEVFGRDASQVMEVLMAGHKGHIDAEDPQVTYLMQASARIAKCMQGAFLPYMQHLLPPVLAYAQLDPKFDMQPVEGDDAGDDQSAVLNIKGMGKMKVTINIKELEDKALGLATLSALAEALQDHFLPYLQATADLMVPCVTYKLSQDVRNAAVEGVVDLIKCLKTSVDKGLAPGGSLGEMWRNVYIQLLQACIVEPSPEHQATVLQSMCACIETCGEGCLDNEQQEHLLKALEPMIEDHIKGREKSVEEDDDEDDEEEREEVLREIVEVLCAALKTHGGAMVQKMSTTILPLVGQLLAPERPASDKSCALNVLVDLVENGGDAAVPMVSNVAAACLQFAGDSNCHIRRSACFGLAVCAQRGGAGFAPAVPQALACMHAIVSAPGSREGENKEATDNAIDAVGRMCQYQGEGMDLTQVLPTWISWLPVQEDLECAQVAHTYLADLMEKGHPAVAPAVQEAVRSVAMIRASVKALADQGLKDRLHHALMTVAPKEQLAQAGSSLDDSLKQHLPGVFA